MKQAAIIALDKCIESIYTYGRHSNGRGSYSFQEHRESLNILKTRAVTGIEIARSLIEAIEKPAEASVQKKCPTVKFPENELEFHIYRCMECGCIFGVDNDFEDQAAVNCPICLTDKYLGPYEVD